MDLMSQTNFSNLVDEIVEGMDDLKASNITILDLRNIENSICSFFVIGEGNSNTQVKAISNSVEKRVRENLKDKPWHVEGLENAEWVLMDYVDTVVHIFQPETRKFYDLESLWGDAELHHFEAKK
ncbi:ribosome silencing factor [Croceimicrobium hydrocarbonivorans]|uniref:Ribosomal silencing factor RsfS n=2 Tax=Croceimicrobium hydrocarbonivorans TaxID=2761580 RepID=A0A7H0VGT8_9FLAO|nr:ribosome silencing factor [Croceimicrobium hydrocarbonivorans]